MSVHVSIHDVSPAWEREVGVALEMVHAAGARPALLVVPDFHGRAPLLQHPAFVERLRRLEREGHEIYLHGYYHHARSPADPAAPRRNVVGRMRHAFAQRVVSAGEAEFSDISPEEATERLDAGERVLEQAGLEVKGFVAPAWSMPRWVLTMLGERGYGFTEDHLNIHDPTRGRSRKSVVLNYASRTPARLFSSVAWCRIARAARRLLPVRIAIHPADMRYALLRQEVASLLEWARREHDFVTHGEALFS
jgi:predicted deacetylase